MKHFAPLMNNYGERETTIVRGAGTRLYDSEGREYLDALSGIAVCGLGHSHPEVTKAIEEQASTLLHCSNLFNIEPQQRLADRLCEISGMDRVFFSNSGTEANEAAIKIAKRYGTSRDILCPEIITFEGSFHGRTLGAVAATANPKIKAGFGPPLCGFLHLPFGDLAAVKKSLSPSTVAIMVEPIQGEGGIQVPPEGFLQGLRKLCDEHGLLLILDEIQTGNGRTGSYFHYQQHGITPDVLTTAKGLGNGVPIGATLAKGPAAEVLVPGSHGTTFGGNPFCCHVADRVVALTNECMTTGAEVGDMIREHIERRLVIMDAVREVRGAGMMIGIELHQPCQQIVGIAKAHGIILNVTADTVIRLLPPLIMSKGEAEILVDKLAAIILEFSESHRHD